MATLMLAVMIGANARAAVPTDTVLMFYREIVKRHPLGIPTGDDKRVLSPFLSRRLIQTLAALKDCEDDYYEGNRRLHAGLELGQLKSSIPWMEYGLFSGGDEMASPAEVAVSRVTPVDESKFHVHVRFTYRDTFETYGRPPDDSNTFEWVGVVVVVRDRDHYVIDDFLPVDRDTGEVEPGLSEAFPECSDGRWVGSRP